MKCHATLSLVALLYGCLTAAATPQEDADAAKEGALSAKATSLDGLATANTAYDQCNTTVGSAESMWTEHRDELSDLMPAQDFDYLSGLILAATKSRGQAAMDKADGVEEHSFGNLHLSYGNESYQEALNDPCMAVVHFGDSYAAYSTSQGYFDVAISKFTSCRNLCTSAETDADIARTVMESYLDD